MVWLEITIRPYQDRFCFYFSAERDNQVLGKVLVYEGKCTDYYIPALFSTAKWKGPDEFVIKDKNKEMELHVFVTENRVELVNLTKYEKPPFFEMMKAGKMNEGAHKDWLHSLPPGAAGAINFDPN